MIAKETFIAGDKVLASDINQIAKNANDSGFRDDINAGESITAFRPVFLDEATGKWKFSDADDINRLNFDGIALEAGTNNNPMKVQLAGLVRGLSSLTPGAKYFIQDDGTIGTTPGTSCIFVGVAVKTTEMAIQKLPQTLPAVDGSQLANIFAFDTVASDNIRNSNDASKQTRMEDYTKIKEIKIDSDFIGATKGVRVAFRLAASPTGGTTRYAKIYKNGSPIGTERSTTGLGTDYDEDFSGFVAGDLIQVYAKSGSFSSGHYAVVSNFRLKYDYVISSILKELMTPLATTHAYPTTNQDPA